MQPRLPLRLRSQGAQHTSMPSDMILHKESKKQREERGSRAATCPMGCTRNMSRKSSGRGNSSIAGGCRPASRKATTNAMCSPTTQATATRAQKAVRAALQEHVRHFIESMRHNRRRVRGRALRLP